LQDIVFRMGANVVTYLSRAHAESRERFVSLSRRTITLTLLAIGLPVTILFGSARAVLQVFGNDFTSGRSSLRVLAVAVLLSSICSAMTAVVVVSVNRATILAWSGAGTQLVGVLVSFPLVRQWGALGASYAQLCAAVLAVLAHFYALSHSNNLTVLRIPIIKIVMVLVVGGGLSAAFDAVLPHPINLVVTFLVVPVVFLVLCLMLDLLPFTEADLVTRVKQRLGRGGPTQPIDSSRLHSDDVLPGADSFVQPDLLLTKD
jgi:O-antigen/teichoic acid export membrane protein